MAASLKPLVSYPCHWPKSGLSNRTCFYSSILSAASAKLLSGSNASISRTQVCWNSGLNDHQRNRSSDMCSGLQIEDNADTCTQRAVKRYFLPLLLLLLSGLGVSVPLKSAAQQFLISFNACIIAISFCPWLVLYTERTSRQVTMDCEVWIVQLKVCSILIINCRLAIWKISQIEWTCATANPVYNIWI